MIERGDAGRQAGRTVGIKQAKFVANPETCGIAASPGVENSIGPLDLGDLPLGHPGTEHLALDQLSLRAAGNAVGEGAANVNPKFPGSH
jgi:hypothetical protein